VKKLLKIVGVLVVLLIVLVVGVYAWASLATSRLQAQTFETHSVDFPIPFPLDPADPAAAGLTEDAARQLAQQRAVERGAHLVASRYTCTACHSKTFGGGVMVDAFPIGSLLAPSLTLGEGSRTTAVKPR